MSAKNLPANLKYLRKLKKLTQKQYAEKISVPHKRYAQWERENGQIQPDIDNLINIANDHHITLDDLLIKELNDIIN